MTQNAIELLRDFHLATGLKVALFDEDFREIYTYTSGDQSFCALLHESAESISVCFASDINARSFVKKNMDIHVFTCPFGLLEALAPIVREGRISGYVFIAEAMESGEHSAAHALSAAAPYLHSSVQAARIEQSLSRLRQMSREEFLSVCNILRVLISHIEEQELLPVPTETLAQKARLYVKRNFDKRLSLADICLNLHCSRASLTAAFRREFGRSVFDYMNDERMKKAEKMLKSRNAGMAEIAEACGFSSAEYFSAAFKKRYGVSPSAWAKK